MFGVTFRSGCIRFYHLHKRSLVLELKTGYSGQRLHGLQFIADRKLLMANILPNKVQVWKMIDEKTLIQLRIIPIDEKDTKCLLVNKDGSQLLYLTWSGKIRVYNAVINSSRSYTLPNGVENVGQMILVGAGKVLVNNKGSDKFSLMY